MRLILLLFLITLCWLCINSKSLDDGMKSHEPCEFPYQSCWDLSWYHRVTPPPESYDAGDSYTTRRPRPRYSAN